MLHIRGEDCSGFLHHVCWQPSKDHVQRHPCRTSLWLQSFGKAVGATAVANTFAYSSHRKISEQQHWFNVWHGEKALWRGMQQVASRSGYPSGQQPMGAYAWYRYLHSWASLCTMVIDREKPRASETRTAVHCTLGSTRSKACKATSACFWMRVPFTVW